MADVLSDNFPVVRKEGYHTLSRASLLLQTILAVTMIEVILSVRLTTLEVIEKSGWREDVLLGPAHPRAIVPKLGT